MELPAVLGITELTLGCLLLVPAIVTLWSIYKRHSLSFLKLMTWITVLSGLLIFFNGFFDLYDSMRQNNGKKLIRWDTFNHTYVSVFFGIIVGVRELAVFSVVWFVTFKYWETAM